MVLSTKRRKSDTRVRLYYTVVSRRGRTGLAVVCYGGELVQRPFVKRAADACRAIVRSGGQHTRPKRDISVNFARFAGTQVGFNVLQKW